MVGRKTLCTDEMIQNISASISVGLSNQDAATVNGIDRSTFYNWLCRGETEIARVAGTRRKIRKREAPFVEFFYAIKKAGPRRKRSLLAHIRSAAQGGALITETRTIKRGKEIVEKVTVEKAAPPQWQAAAWLLERINPEEFSKRIQVRDWREEAKADGIDDPDAVLESLVQKFQSAMAGGDGTGSADDSKAEDEGNIS